MRHSPRSRWGPSRRPLALPRRASVLLDTSIEYEATLASTVKLAVPEVADYCIVVLVNEDGTTRWAHWAHRDSAKQALLERLAGHVPGHRSPELPRSEEHTSELQSQSNIV